MISTTQDLAQSLAVPFQQATQRLVNEVFCDGQAGPADKTAEPTD